VLMKVQFRGTHQEIFMRTSGMAIAPRARRMAEDDAGQRAHLIAVAPVRTSS
jgi:hypothetical protein